MSHRPPRQDRDVRLIDPHPHAHSLPPPPHALPHSAPHLNGSSIPNTPLPPGAVPPPPASIATSPAVPNGSGSVLPASVQKLAQANEQTWLLVGRVAEQMGNLEHALSAYEHALRHNPASLPGLTQVAGIARIKENYPKAVEYFQRVLDMQRDNGEVWSALGHCYLMQDDLQKAYAAYQQALYLLPNPKEDPKLWYGIGILYDRYGSLDHAEEAFSSVLKMDKDFDKANEILFRLGIIYKQQGKYVESLECFDRILRNPPNPLAHADIWFQIGHVYEQQHDHVRAREAYERVVQDNPGHAKVLQQLGWLYHQDGSSFQNQELAIQYLTKSLEADASDAQSWYLLGRAYMAGQKYNKAYEAYQQAVYRDGRNPTFWCSIGVLYFQINQYRDALDAYSRAIRINPYISEVWFDLGSLYESCNNQISDAIDAYARAAELDPGNHAIATRLALLKNAQATGQSLPAAPGPQDVHPTAYANPMLHQPAGLSGPPLMLQPGPNQRPLFRADSRGPANNDLPLPLVPPQLAGRSSPGPFRGGPPPPVILDDNQRAPSHTALAPMEIDRPGPREASAFGRDGPRGPPSSLLLHHPVPQPQGPPAGHAHENFNPRPLRMHSRSQSPPPPRLPAFQDRPPVGPSQPPHAHSRSPRMYAREISGEWDRRGPPSDREREQREWEREQRERERVEQMRGRPNGEYAHPSQPQPPYYSRPHSPSAYSVHSQHRDPSRGPRGERERESPSDTSPRSAHPGYGRATSGFWDPKQAGPPLPPSVIPRGRSPPSMLDNMEPAGRRYDPRFDARERSQPRDFERERIRELEREREIELQRLDQQHQQRYPIASPEMMRMRHGGPPPPPPPPPSSSSGPGQAAYARTSESPRMAEKARAGPVSRRAPGSGSSNGSAAPPVREIEVSSPGLSNGGGEQQKKERKRRAPRRPKDDTPQPQMPPQRQDSSQYGLQEYRAAAKGGSGSGGHGSPEPMSSHGSDPASANRSAQPSPTNSVHLPPSREIDEDYDAGVADALLNMSKTPQGYRSGPADPRNFGPPPYPLPNGASPPSTGRIPAQSSPHALSKHPAMMAGSGSGRPSPPMNKRPLSPGPDDAPGEAKRSRVGSMSRRVSSPTASTTSSGREPPIPFRQQPTSHSPEVRQGAVDVSSHPPSPALPTMLPPHPRPIGGAHVNARSPTSPGRDERERERDVRMRDSRSNSPNAQRMPKREIVVQSVRSPTAGQGPMPKGTPSPASSHGSHGSLGGKLP